MREIASALIENDNGEMLVVDKPKSGGRILTILPGGKVGNDEEICDALYRELKEELGINRNQTKLTGYYGEIEGNSPTSGTVSKIIVFKVELIVRDIHFQTNAEVQSPRFLTPEEVINLDTTTELTRKIAAAILVT